MKLWSILAAMPLLAACAMNAGNLEPLENAAGDRCDPAPVLDYVGDKATARVGREILARSGARKLRWGAPDSIWTMELDPYRVNVRYDDAAVITAITCG